MISWQLLPFNQIDSSKLYDLLRLRTDIFVVEQNCPYPELDGKDKLDGAFHLMGFIDGELIACARLFKPGITCQNVNIGRIAIKKSARGSGFARKLLTEALKQCETLWPGESIDIGAQEYLEAFYLKYGFITISEIYLEDQIPHIDMRLQK